jgi:hypothetical protein
MIPLGCGRLINVQVLVGFNGSFCPSSHANDFFGPFIMKYFVTCQSASFLIILYASYHIICFATTGVKRGGIEGGGWCPVSCTFSTRC